MSFPLSPLSRLGVCISLSSAPGMLKFELAFMMLTGCFCKKWLRRRNRYCRFEILVNEDADTHVLFYLCSLTSLVIELNSKAKRTDMQALV
jgi:hypothetical protein